LAGHDHKATANNSPVAPIKARIMKAAGERRLRQICYTVSSLCCYGISFMLERDLRRKKKETLESNE